jgi:hypothetical protein
MNHLLKYIVCELLKMESISIFIGLESNLFPSLIELPFIKKSKYILLPPPAVRGKNVIEFNPISIMFRGDIMERRILTILILVFVALSSGCIFDGIDEGVNEGPTPKVDVSDNTPYVGDVVFFNGSRSDDRDGRIISYRWEIFQSSTGKTLAVINDTSFEWIFNETGEYYVYFDIEDDDGRTDRRTIRVRVSESMELTYNIDYGHVNLTIGKELVIKDFKFIYERENWNVRLRHNKTNKTLAHFWIKNGSIHGCKSFKIRFSNIINNSLEGEIFPYNETDYYGRGIYFPKYYNETLGFPNGTLKWINFNEINQTGEFEIIDDEGVRIIFLKKHYRYHLNFVSIWIRSAHGIECSGC